MDVDPQGLTGVDAERSSSEEPEPAGLAEGSAGEARPSKPNRIANLTKPVISGLISACKRLFGPAVALVNRVFSAVLWVVNGVIASVLWLLNRAALVVLLVTLGVLVALIQGWL